VGLLVIREHSVCWSYRLEAAIVMMDQIGIRFVLICNLILWAVLVYLLVLAVR
jgi:hypothetical protein